MTNPTSPTCKVLVDRDSLLWALDALNCLPLKSPYRDPRLYACLKRCVTDQNLDHMVRVPREPTGHIYYALECILNHDVVNEVKSSPNELYKAMMNAAEESHVKTA